MNLTESRSHSALLALVFVASSLCGFSSARSIAHADDTSGALSPTRLKLPRGPGSLEGVGENAEANLNMGFATYGVPFSLPAGQQGLTPSLGLRYASNGGASVVGLGWTLGGVSCIERMTARGLPDYDTNDLFSADGGAELARVSGGSASQRIYRERMESSFSRYTWIDGAGTGVGGHWKVESADGRVSYYGARADGTIVPEARLVGRGGAVFAYYLAETVDPFGHRIVYDYVLDGGRPFLTVASWGFETFATNATPRYTAALTYEPRTDVLTDAKPGLVVQLTQRLSSVSIRVGGQQLRRYALSYESYATSGGLSRLSNVRTYGTDDVTFNPIQFSFAYSRGLDPTCMVAGSSSCPRPERHTVGSFGANLTTGNIDFVDMDGDALPDVLDTTSGVHRIYLQRLDSTGQPSLLGVQTSSVAASVGTGSLFLSSPNVEVTDLDGDGRSDLVDRLNQVVLRGGASTGDWRSSELLDTHMPSLTADADLRFLDVDYDRETDLIHLDSSGAWYFRNTGNGIYATSATALAGLGRGFTSDGLRLADMNGDGMADAVQFVVGGGLWYFPNLGFGEFGAAVVMPGVPSGWTVGVTDLVDISGDGLTDLVEVIGNEVRFVLNRDAASFGAEVVVTGADVTGGIPTRVPQTSMRFLDMNANGTTDIVYASSSGQLEYVELFVERPNLLTRIDNGIGKRIDLAYGTIADHMARDGGAGAASGWAHTLPHPMIVLDSITVTDARTNTPQIQQIAYRSGYWDAVEHQFRGFEEVWLTTPGDADVETGETLHSFDVGAVDRYHRGLATRTETRSNSRVLSVSSGEWSDCPLAQAGATGALPVRWICSPRVYTDVIEGLSAAETVRTEEDYQYDTYGNRTATHKLGVVSRGGQACGACARDTSSVQGAPCGEICVGDELHELVDFVVPGAGTNGRWMLRIPYRRRTFGIDGSAEIAEERTYYDGTNFAGLALGNVDRGAVRRVERRRASGVDSWLPAQRSATDSHGNTTIALDPNGHARTFSYDGAGLLIEREEIEFDDVAHTPYALRISVTYDPLIEQVVSSTAWTRIEGGNSLETPRVTTYAYDELARLTKVAEPGDTLVEPTREFIYELADPVSRILTRRRSGPVGTAPDLESIQCFDGLGRKFQERERIDSGRYQITRHQDFDSHGEPSRMYQGFVGTSGICDLGNPPAGVLYDDSRRDASNRVVEVVHPDGVSTGHAASTERTVFRPLSAESWDEEDNDQASPHANTPTTDVLDGLGRLSSRLRTVADDVGAIATTVTYDSLGRIRTLSDDAGNEQTQVHDLLGRIISVTRSDSGTSAFTYDDANNLLVQTDARGLAVGHAYDEANRIVATFDPSDPRATTRFSYDGSCTDGRAECPNGDGALVEIVHPLLAGQTARERISRDERGREVGRRIERGSRQYVFANAFDNANRQVARTYPSGMTVFSELDGLGRLVKVPDYVDEIAYEPRGQTTRIALSNGVTSHYDFDSRLRLISLRTSLPGDAEDVQSVQYDWDRAGNITSVVDGRPLPDDMPSESATFAYDSLYRIRTAQIDIGRSTAETVTYRYDRIDNVSSISSNGGMSSVAHVGDIRYGENGAGPHSPTMVGADSYSYDAAGHVTSRLGLRHEWDFMGRLRATRSFSTDALVTETAYGGAWSRAEQKTGEHATEYVAPDFDIRDGIATIYVRHGERTLVRIEQPAFAVVEMPDTDGNGRIDSADAWRWSAASANAPGIDLSAVEVPSGPQVDVAVMLAESAERRLLGGEQRVATFEHTDHLGTVVAETDAEGNVLFRALVYPSGVSRMTQGSSSSRHGFTGMERDQATGLQLHGARWFDARASSWASDDVAFERLEQQVMTDSDGSPRIDKFVEGSNPRAYARGRLMIAFDHTGFLTQIVVWTQLSTEASHLVGHVTIRINDTNYSWETTGMRVGDWTRYDNARNRAGNPGVAFTIDLTSDQEAALAATLQAYHTANPAGPASEAKFFGTGPFEYNGLTNNCGQVALRSVLSVSPGLNLAVAASPPAVKLALEPGVPGLHPNTIMAGLAALLPVGNAAQVAGMRGTGLPTESDGVGAAR